MKRLLLALVLGLVAVPAATAGGWATVGLSSLPPSGLQAGEDWPLDITVLQHGKTPLDGVKPVLTIRGDGGAVERFPATPTGKPGVYHTVVRFPDEGTWSYEVWDGFTLYGNAKTHTFRPVTIGGGDTSSFPILPVGGAAVVVLLGGALGLYLRRSRHAPQPAPAGR